MMTTKMLNIDDDQDDEDLNDGDDDEVVYSLNGLWLGYDDYNGVEHDDGDYDQEDHDDGDDGDDDDEDLNDDGDDDEVVYSLNGLWVQCWPAGSSQSHEAGRSRSPDGGQR